MQKLSTACEFKVGIGGCGLVAPWLQRIFTSRWRFISKSFRPVSTRPKNFVYWFGEQFDPLS